ncbi:MAG: hypothetical protein COV31_02045 [Candidatus Yanofskybacteria bacterium CG10_big_fil_rev_8_21_14_0_10_46_23]|uniref:Cell division protein FtsX n=1 Tax=Candidatus Yanofskybacteria bacterium CG10_big_fil_rev_8_21_14_0_10_46_23 TaxID=1975098 RepID=A0A2H0R3Y3_9BACT|nr:MAG: hypothetical protein COV31_02045 [Candidatus Yanofskybacteria bacterium CG10_big_fil_rev_8_21_14_0_10_46_23]
MKQLRRIISTGWTNFRRNSYLSFSAVAIMSIALILLLGLVGFNFLTSKTVDSLQGKVDVSIYFRLDAEEAQILSLRDEINDLSNVVSTDYISRDEALELFKARHSEDALIQESLAELDDNPLQASLSIKATEASEFPQIVSVIEDSPYASTIDSIDFFENEAVITRIQSFSNGIRSWGLAITLVLIVIAVFVTFNTIRLTIYDQRKEIEIMKLVGASDWQVRAPYIAEGSFYGLLAGLITLVLTYGILYGLSDRIAALTGDIDLFAYFSQFWLQIVLLVLVVGVTLGVASSFIAIRRHLKV